MHGNDHDRVGRLEERVKRLREVTELRATLTSEALHLQARDLDTRLEKLNEFRGALADAQSHFVSSDTHRAAMDDFARRIDRNRDEYQSAHRDLVDRVDTLASVVAGTTGTSAGTMRVFLVVAVGISLLGLIVTTVHLIGG